MMFSSLDLLARERVYRGETPWGKDCQVTFVENDRNELVQLKLKGEIADTLHCRDLIGGRSGRSQYEATFDSAENFVDGFTLKWGEAGQGDLISGIGYRMPYLRGRYETGYQPTAKQTVTVFPSISTAESLYYRAEDLFVPAYPLGGICQLAPIGQGSIPLETVEFACLKLTDFRLYFR
jgi:hypothetical protein